MLQDAGVIARAIEHVWSRMCRVERGEEFEQAWMQLYGEVNKIVRAVLCGMHVPAQERDDLAQTILTEVVASLPRFLCGPGQSGFASWLRRLAHDKVVDQRRRLDHRPEFAPLPSDHADPAVASLRDEPARVLGHHETAATLEQFLRGIESEIPPEHLTQFRRHFVDGESIPVIATSSGARVSSVTSRLARARLKLRARLARLVGTVP